MSAAHVHLLVTRLRYYVITADRNQLELS